MLARVYLISNVSQIRSHGADVVVDLMGYTHGAREKVLAMKPGTLQ